MARAGQAYRPSMSDEAVKAKTGKTWAEWFAALDKAKAATMPHKEIAQLLHGKMGVPGWWSQMVTVEYERARGLRTKHETVTGYSVSISKTLACNLSELFAATADAKARKKWFPKGTFQPSSETENKYLRGSWNGDARLEIGFYVKPGGKSQITVQVNKLAKKTDVEAERVAWKKALERLETILT